MGLVASAATLAAGLAFALIFPFHDRCVENTLHVNCIGDELCRPVICSGWGVKYRILTVVFASLIALIAIVVGIWSAYWSDRRATSDGRIRA